MLHALRRLLPMAVMTMAASLLVSATPVQAASFGYTPYTQVSTCAKVLKSNPLGSGRYVVRFKNLSCGKRTFFLDKGKQLGVAKVRIGKGQVATLRTALPAGNTRVALRVRYPELDYALQTQLAHRGDGRKAVTRRQLPTANSGVYQICVRNPFKRRAVLNIDWMSPGGSGFKHLGANGYEVRPGRVACVGAEIARGTRYAFRTLYAHRNGTRYRTVESVFRPKS